jgi:hypothetical protein
MATPPANPKTPARVAAVNRYFADTGHSQHCIYHEGMKHDPIFGSVSVPDKDGFEYCPCRFCEPVWGTDFRGLRPLHAMNLKHVQNLCSVAEQQELLPEMVSGTMSKETFVKVWTIKYGKQNQQRDLDELMPAVFAYAATHYKTQNPRPACGDACLI